MTPTEQDKKIIRGIEKALEKSFSYQVLVLNKECRDELTQLIIADRKRVALEARIAERNKIALDTYRGRTVSESTNWQAMYGRFMDSNERRIAGLKAQQEDKDE